MAITFINSTALTIGTAASTWSIPTHSSRLGGSAFVVGLGPASSAVTISAVSDNTTNTYLLAKRAVTPIPAASAELWYATGISSLSTRVSITLSGNSSGSIGLGQFSGVSTNNALLASTYGAITANSTVHSLPQMTPSSNNALAVAYYRTHDDTMSPTAWDGSFIQWVSTGGAIRSLGGYIIQVAAATVTAQWRTNAAGTSGGVQHSGVMAIFSDTQAAPPPFAGGVDCFSMLGAQ